MAEIELEEMDVEMGRMLLLYSSLYFSMETSLSVMPMSACHVERKGFADRFMRTGNIRRKVKVWCRGRLLFCGFVVAFMKLFE